MSGQRVVMVCLLGCLALMAAAAGAQAQCDETSVPIWGGPQAGAEFGFAAAMAPNVAVVGAPGWESSPGVPIGLVTVARWNGSTWVPEALPTPSSAQPGDRFGAAVAINEDATVIAVGAPLHDGGVTDGGLLVIYEWNTALFAWEIVAEWPGIFNSGMYGFAVDASGDRILVGEPGGLFLGGVVNIYRRTGPKAWAGEAFWVGAAGDFLGWSVAIEGGVMALGAPLADPPGLTDAGMVYTKSWNGANWMTREDIPGWNDGDFSGWAVDVYDDYLAIGQPGFTSSGTPGSGHGMVGTWDGSNYFFSAGVWDMSGNGGSIGHDVAVSYYVCGVGAPGKTVASSGSNTGEIRLMQHVDDHLFNWKHTDPSELLSTSPQAGAQFGFAMAAEGHRLLVASPFQDVGGLTDAGIVKVLETKGEIDFVDQGNALAGYGGQLPHLTGVSGLCHYPRMYLWMTNGRPNAFVTWVLGIDPLFAPFKGGVMVPDADLIIPYALTWPDGSVAAVGDLPVGLPAYPIWLQAWITDSDGPAGFSASNGVRIDIPAF
jgi:hypothetical protein